MILRITLFLLSFSILADPSLLGDHCLRCHNADKRKGELRLDTRAAAIKGGENGTALVPGKADESPLISSLSPDSDPHMPPKKQVSVAEIATLRAWVNAGAEWDKPLRPREAPPVAEFAEFPRGHAAVTAMALSPDESLLAVGRGNSIDLIELGEKRTLIASLEAHRDSVNALAWSASGDLLYSGGYRQLIRWQRGDWAPEEIAVPWRGRLTALAVADKELLVADRGQIHRLNCDTWDHLGTIDAHADSIFDLDLSPDGKLLASASADKLVKLWSAPDWQPAGVLEGHTGYVLATAFDPKTTRLASTGDDEAIKIWKLDTHKKIGDFGAGKTKGVFTDLAWTETKDSKDLILTSNENKTPRQYTDLVDHVGSERSGEAKQRDWTSGESPLTVLAWRASTREFFAGGQDGSITVWGEDGKPRERLAVAAESATQAISFRNDILPVLSRSGCNAGSCHAKAGGQKGFALSIFAYDPVSDHREIVFNARGRRVFPGAPEHSLLLLKPTEQIAHEGGQRFTPDSKTYRLIRDWISQGMPYTLPDEPELREISVSPPKSEAAPGATVQLAVSADFSDDSSRVVTHLAHFSSTDADFATVDEDGQVTLGQQGGQALVIVRYMGQVAVARIAIPRGPPLPESAFADLPIANEIDRLAYQQHRIIGLRPSARCDDATFIRRTSLDSIGRLPTPERVRAFLADSASDKRQRLIDELLAQPEWADYWTTMWADMIRPNTQRVGVKPVYLLDRWLRRKLRANTPYDAMVRELLSATGSTHEHGPAVLFRDKRTPEDVGEFVGRVFLGVRLECARCHHHPSEKWGQDDYYQFAAFFRDIGRKGQGISAPISGEPEYIYHKPGGSVRHPVGGELMEPRALAVAEFAELGEVDPRQALLDWMLLPDNPYFAKTIVNRIWAAYFGRGIVHPVDDFRLSNPPANAPLLDWLAADFVANGYDLRQLMRRIMQSQLYQQQSQPNETNLTDTQQFSRAYRRRLPSEVMLDAVCDVTGAADKFDGLPEGGRAVQTWNSKMPSTFLDTFGRPDSSAECPCERAPAPSMVQALHLMNGQSMQTKLSSEAGRARQLAKAERPLAEVIDELYLAALSRFPDEDERTTALTSFDGADRKIATEDLLWALLNSAEFVFNH
ncbi:MAG: WD40 repeat protein [Rhodothermales bacterium]|jgi:WD40 repeat protein